MSNRERRREPERLAAGPVAGADGDDSLESIRAAGAEFLRAGRDAIQRALSGDSEAFLEANRQQGGQ